MNGDLFETNIRRRLSSVIPVRFEHGHSEYLEYWEHYFTYEVYSMLLNSKRSETRDERPN